MAHDDQVDRVSFITDGCGSSIACGSMLTTLAEGRSIEDAASLRQQDILSALGGLPPGLEHCALLAASTFEAVCEDYFRRRAEAPDEARMFTRSTEAKSHKEDEHMKIAIPLANGKLTMHFGHCGSFALVDVDPTEKKIIKREDIEAPPHQPGLLPPWLAERGVNMIIAGGMGQRAQGLFAQQGIQVVVGAPADTPESLVGDYLAGTLQAGENVCDH